MDALVSLQTQTGSAELCVAVGSLELRFCDISRECSLASFIGYCHESVRAVVLETGGNSGGRWAPFTSVTVCSLKFFQLDAPPLKVPLHSVLVTRASSPYSSWRGMRGSSILMICPTHRSWALMSKVWMLIHCARSRTSRFVMRSCQRMPKMERRHACERSLVVWHAFGTVSKSRIHPAERSRL